jgi:glyoxylase-like metal-dependent hydrolase (beta-lactamase superfamily II)
MTNSPEFSRVALDVERLEADLGTPCRTSDVGRLDAVIWRIVAPNPSPLTGPGTNTYVVGADRQVVIDPGPDDESHLSRILALTGGTIDRVLCTHSHPDHSPAAARLREITGARVYGQPAPRDGYQDESYAPDAGLDDGERIAAAGLALRVLHTPGHASNHVCFLTEGSGLLFTGDHLMSGSTVVIIPPDGSMRHYLQSLNELRTRPVAAIAPGHGPVIPDAIGEIDRVIEHRLTREAKVVRALRRRGTATIGEVLPEVYDDVPVSLHAFARLSLLAHVIKLEEEGRVVREGDAHRWRGD